MKKDLTVIALIILALLGLPFQIAGVILHALSRLVQMPATLLAKLGVALIAEMDLENTGER